LEITTSDPAQDLPIPIRQSGATGAAPPAAFLEQILTDTHAHHDAPQPCDHLVTDVIDRGSNRDRAASLE